MSLPLFFSLYCLIKSSRHWKLRSKYQSTESVPRDLLTSSPISEQRNTYLMLRESLESIPSPHPFFFSIFLLSSDSDCKWWQWEITEGKTPKEEKFSWFIVWCLTLTWEILLLCSKYIFCSFLSIFPSAGVPMAHKLCFL